VGILRETDKKVLTATDLGATLSRGLREAAFLAYVAIAMFILIALFTFDPRDGGWTHSGSGKQILNGGGAVGAWLSDFTLSLFGLMAYLFPFMLAGYGHSIYKGVYARSHTNLFGQSLRWMGLALAMAAGSALADIHVFKIPVALPETAGESLARRSQTCCSTGSAIPALRSCL
jgi:DNA segregation ATPase FtsK/SpoIIIE, S-DNA-T family